MYSIYLNEKKHKYGIIDDVIRIDPPVKKYFLERLQRLGRLQGIKCKI